MKIKITKSLTNVFTKNLDRVFGRGGGGDTKQIFFYIEEIAQKKFHCVQKEFIHFYLK